MAHYNTLSRTSKEGIGTKEEGYVLGITLIVLTVSLLCVASFFKRQVAHEEWVETLQQTSSNRLVGQHCLDANGEQLIADYEAALKKVWEGYAQSYGTASDTERANLAVLAAAKAYVTLTQSFFHTQSWDGTLYNSHLRKQRFKYRTPSLDSQTLTNVQCYNYVEGIQFLSKFSKSHLAGYYTIKKKMEAIEKGMEPVKKEVEIQNIKSELLDNCLYEIDILVTVERDGIDVQSKAKMYLTLKLTATGEQATYEQVPYRLSVEDYNLDVKD